MKQISGLIFTALLLAAGTTSAASIEHEEILLEKLPPRAAPHHVVFHKNVSRQVDRVIEIRLDRVIETHLSSQADLMVASMYESPTSLAPFEIEVGL